MASEPFNPQPQGADSSPSDQLVVNLQVVSPSVGVNRPLLFPGLSAATTIKQLKEKIRQTLPLRPSDENQRLIHRGRALLRDTDTLLDILGADTLRSPDQQTIHLVIRDVSDGASSTSSPMTGTQSSAPGIQPPSVPRQNPPQLPNPPYPPPPRHPYPPPSYLSLADPRRNPFQPTPTTTLPQPRMPSPARSHSPAHTPEQAAAFQQQHQNMTHWLTHLQREAMARAIVNQNQRGRAHLGMRGIGDPAANNGGNAAETNSGRASPAPTHTIYRETIGPNGHGYHVETIIRTSSSSTAPASSAPAHQGALPSTDVHNIIRAADTAQAMSISMGHTLHRSASNNSLHNRPLAQSGVTASVFAAGGSRTSSGRATPDQGLRPGVVAGGIFPTTSVSWQPQSRQGVDVYLVSSPEGPRALLFNNATAETYYTPRLFRPSSNPQLRHAAGLSNLIHGIQPQSRDDDHHQTPQVEQRQTLQDQQALGQQQQQQQQQQQPGVLPLHPNNPPAAGIPLLLMQMAPHFWLIIRLALFVWFFTSPNSSWSRWLTIISLAVFIFAFSTGLLNGIAEHAWRPLGQHLENVFPAVDPERVRREAAAGRDPRAVAQEREQNPNPAQLATRLVAERRQRGSWIVGQIRRLERAGLLFLASIAPGVAERHIANFEAEARAEENRRREAEAAAAAAAESNTQNDGENAAHNSGGENTQQQSGLQGGEQQDTQGGGPIREEIAAL